MGLSRRLLLVFVPLLAFLALAEVAARLFTRNEDRLVSVRKNPRNPITEPDPDLGWRLVPGFVDERRGMTIRINSTGQRSPEVAPKAPDEFRILSLGESTTYGAFVDSEETYSARLAELLSRRRGSPVTVINAGVSAYSSYQSLQYLLRDGQAFQPDAVLFYHEVNDYLPTAIRGGELVGEIGLLKTDKQLYGSGLYRLNARLLELSYFYGWYARAIARFRIEWLSRSGPGENPLGDIELPELRIGTIAEVSEGAADGSGEARGVVRPDLRPAAVGRRVSEAERREILEDLAAWCAEHDVALVLIHPSYRDSVRHECVLTRFAAEHGVVVFEAYDALHPAGVPVEAMFVDVFHPTARGHEALAQGLARLIGEKLLPKAEEPIR